MAPRNSIDRRFDRAYQHVVPAQAGTHMPQHLDWSDAAEAFFHLRGQGLWVTASAGTTSYEGSG
jgi:hypothetical protein